MGSSVLSYNGTEAGSAVKIWIVGDTEQRRTVASCPQAWHSPSDRATSKRAAVLLGVDGRSAWPLGACPLRLVALRQ